MAISKAFYKILTRVLDIQCYRSKEVHFKIAYFIWLKFAA